MSFEVNKNLSSVGALRVAVGFSVPVLGVTGMTLLLIGIKGLADPYSKQRLFNIIIIH